MATIASLLVKIMGDSSQLSDSLKKATDKMQTFGDSATAIGQTLSTRLTLPLVAFATIAVREFGKEEDAIARLNGALKANAGQSGITASEIKALAESLEATTNVTADATMSAAALLSTFHQVSNQAGENNDVFTRTIKISADLAALMGTDMTSATMQLAKALENPTIGLGALSRSGTTFTEQQKEQIKTLVESGRQLEAQTMILDVVESQYKGIAEELAKTTSGRIKNAFNELGKTVDSFGQIISEAIAPIIEMVTKFAQGLDGMDESTKRFVVTLGAFAAGIGPVVYGIGLLTSGIRGLTIAMANNPYTAIAIGILAIASATYMAIKGVNDYEKALLKLAGVDAITGSEEERNKLLERQKVILRDLESAQGRLSRAQGTTARASEEGKIARYKEELGTIDQLLAKSNALSWQNYELEKSAQDAADASNALTKGLSGTTTEAEFQSGSIGSLNEQLQELKAEFEATGNSVRRAQLAFQIRGITAEIERITAQTEPLDRLTIGVQKLGKAGLVRGQIPLAELPEKVKEMNTQLANSPVVIQDMTAQITIAQQFAQQFTDSFGAGMANLIVSGGKFVDILKDIGKLMLSAAIQTFIKYMLLGSAGFGVKGGSQGLIGGLFAGSASMGNIGTVTPASASLTLDGQFQIRGTDLVYVMNRAERSLR